MDRENKHIELSLSFLTIKTTYPDREQNMPDIRMCESKTCENRKACRRSPDSGTVAGPRQSWSNFKEEGKACSAYWMIPMDVIRERRNAAN